MDIRSASCPFCHIWLPLPELEWHVNNHLDEDESARDMDLALQLAINPELSSHTMESAFGCSLQCQEAKLADSVDFSVGGVLHENSSGPRGRFRISEGKIIQDQISVLLSGQIKSNFYKIEEGFTALLRNCLELERGITCSAISGHIDHFQSLSSEDLGWGCGWRNIQMLSSHLLVQTWGAKEVLFGGSGFVPDIPSLQRWLEIAWHRGFDEMGAASFDSKIYGSKKWIGATECAAILRSFGLRARIVDFGCEAVKNRICSGDALSQSLQRKDRCTSNIKQIIGPLDRYLHFGVQCDGCEAFPIRGVRFKSMNKENFDLCSNCMDAGKYSSSEYVKIDMPSSSSFTNHSKAHYTGKIDNHQLLVDWVWNYFVGGASTHLKTPFDDFQERIITSQQTPLYFQHDGHSRTIVGIQRRRKSHGTQEEEAILLVLDPAQRTEDLARALRQNAGWQKLVKRGVHTLRKPEYQLCYVDPGIAHDEELEQLKILESVVFKY